MQEGEDCGAPREEARPGRRHAGALVLERFKALVAELELSAEALGELQARRDAARDRARGGGAQRAAAGGASGRRGKARSALLERGAEGGAGGDASTQARHGGEAARPQEVSRSA